MVSMVSVSVVLLIGSGSVDHQPQERCSCADVSRIFVCGRKIPPVEQSPKSVAPDDADHGEDETQLNVLRVADIPAIPREHDSLDQYVDRQSNNDVDP